MTNVVTGRQLNNVQIGVVFAGVAFLWLVLDRVTKVFFESTYQLGQMSQSYGPIRFRLVHNTGAAWGMFDDSTFALGIVSCLVCVLVIVAVCMWERLFEHKPTLVEVVALSLVFSGGVGNAIDRFTAGYVVDFLDFTFMDFPVFNIADIGVTCGFALLVIGYLVAVRPDARHENLLDDDDEEDDEDADGADDATEADEPAADDYAAEATEGAQSSESSSTGGLHE